VTHANRHKKVLLVDDESGICKVLGISLADAGYEVHTAENGVQALDMFGRISPRIVITDIKMPSMDGIELLRRIKKTSPDTEVIMITGHGDIDLAIRSLKLDATDFITKPIAPEALEVALKRAEDKIALKEQLKAYTENLEQLVEEKTRRLVEAERMAAVGQTVAGLSHAIKNIAGGLKGGSFVLEKGIELDNRRYLEQGWDLVRVNVEKITRLSLDLLGYAREGGISCREWDPNQPAREVYELMSATADPAGVDLRLQLEGRLGPIFLDPEGIHRCLLNLVTNAVEACSAPDCPSRTRTVTIETAPGERGGVTYRIKDSCGGMDETVRENLFKGFFTTKGSRGTGIGLMLTKKIVDAHGGSLEVETRAGAGSTFTFSIPGNLSPDHPA
jgi:signal transduction histidine kinase